MSDDNDIDKNIRLILDGHILSGWTWVQPDGWPRPRKITKEARIGKTTPPGFPDRFLTCIFSYEDYRTGDPHPATGIHLLTHERLETGSLEHAVAFAARHEPNFSLFRPHENDHRFFCDDSHVETWLRNRGCREQAIPRIVRFERLEGRHPGSQGRFRFIEIQWDGLAPPSIDPKEAIPEVQCTTYEMDIGAPRDVYYDFQAPQYEVEHETFYDIIEGLEWGLQYVPNVETWFPSGWWEEWDENNGVNEGCAR